MKKLILLLAAIMMLVATACQKTEVPVIVRYNLAFINHALCAKDNGRVVGYDNSHGAHHRHFAGAEEKFAFISYERLLERFLDEVRELRQRKESI